MTGRMPGPAVPNRISEIILSFVEIGNRSRPPVSTLLTGFFFINHVPDFTDL
jgi:hypothetical protein